MADLKVDVLYIGNDAVIELNGLKKSTGGAFINDATVVCNIYDKNGVLIAGPSWPVAMPYVAASDGIYRGIVDKSMAITYGAFYSVEVIAASSGDDARWSTRVQAQNRT